MATGRILRCIAVGAAMLGATVANGAPHCLKYGPENVVLEGMMREQTFAGRPNYGDVKEGDEPERHWVLHLVHPVCVHADPTDAIQQAEHDVRAVQVVVPEHSQQWRPLLARKVRVTGSLFHAHTAHHHTAVLIQASRIEPGD